MSTATNTSTDTRRSCLLACQASFTVDLWNLSHVGAAAGKYRLHCALLKQICSFEFTSVPSGKTDITWMMLDAGAETDVTNSVGRTAAQMAAFVG